MRGSEAAAAVADATDGRDDGGKDGGGSGVEEAKY